MSSVNQRYVFACALILGSCAAEVSAAGLRSEIKVGATTLTLNGAGARSKAFVQLYESGLYLQRPSRDAATILAADEPMAIRVKITSRFVSQSALVSSLREGLQKSTRGNTSAIESETQQFLQCMTDPVKKQDIFDFLHLTGRGIFVFKNGELKGNVPGLAFKQAFFGIWLSDNPADATLKQAMLSAKSLR